MSRLLQPNGDDHPEAARRHLLDAEILLGQGRSDGAAYLSGYVVECSLKALWLLETGAPASGRMPWGRQGHELIYLTREVTTLAAVAGSRTARYLGVATRSVPTATIGRWNPEMRYRPAAVTNPDAMNWHAFARAVLTETIHQMDLDGVL